MPSRTMRCYPTHKSLRHKRSKPLLPNPSIPINLLPHNLQSPHRRPPNLPRPLTPRRHLHNLPSLSSISLHKSHIHNLQKRRHHSTFNLICCTVVECAGCPSPGIGEGERSYFSVLG